MTIKFFNYGNTELFSIFNSTYNYKIFVMLFFLILFFHID
jgi:hypothetical protein